MRAGERKRALRVALVLGAGGPVGSAFHAGVLRAIAEHGWDARDADLVVGTSAGAQAGALLRAGLSATELYARALAQPAPLVSHAITRRRVWPASTRYLAHAIRRPWQLKPGRFVAALLPEGARGNEPLGDAFEQLHPHGWPTRPLFINAVHLDSGARVVFGRSGAPVVSVGAAVRCSSAVPGVRRPVLLHGLRYVDGGIASPTNADVLHGQSIDVAIVLSPLSRFAPLKILLRRELEPLSRRGVHAIVIEPDREVVAAMGWNPMNPSVMASVAEAAHRAAERQLARAPLPL